MGTTIQCKDCGNKETADKMPWDIWSNHQCPKCNSNNIEAKLTLF